VNLFRLDLVIDRPVEAVFAFLADSENAPQWYAALDTVDKLTAGPVRQGTRYRMTRTLPQGTVVNVVETTELVPGERVTLESRTGPTPFTYRYDLSPAAGGTRVKLEGSITGKCLQGPAALLAPLAQGQFKRGMADNLRTLRRVLEGG
jgi:uncharacterized protein YndB with AHSA1/START domain